MNIGLEVLKDHKNVSKQIIDPISLVIDICQTAHNLELDLIHCQEILLIQDYIQQYGASESLCSICGLNTNVSIEGVGKVIGDTITFIKEKLKKLGELFIKAYNWIREKIFNIKSKKQIDLDQYAVHYNPKTVIDYIDEVSAIFDLASTSCLFSIDYALIPEQEDEANTSKRIDSLSEVKLPSRLNEKITITDSEQNNVCIKIIALLNTLEMFIKKDCQRNIDNLNANIKHLESDPLNSGNSKAIECSKRFISMTSKLASKAIECSSKLATIYDDYTGSTSDDLDTEFKSKYGDFPEIVKAINDKDMIRIRSRIITLMDFDYTKQDNRKNPIALKVAIEIDNYLKKHKVFDEPLFVPDNGRANLPPINEATADTLHSVRAAMYTNFSIEKIRYNRDVILRLYKISQQ